MVVRHDEQRKQLSVKKLKIRLVNMAVWDSDGLEGFAAGKR